METSGFCAYNEFRKIQIEVLSMKVERIAAVPLEKGQAIIFAAKAAEEHMNKRVGKAVYLGGGSFGRAVKIIFADGQEIVVKLLRAQGMLAKEVHDLALLKSCCSADIPAVLFSRPKGGGIPVDLYAMEKIEGKIALLSFKLFFSGKRTRLAFADKVTEALHELHGHTHKKFGDTMNPDCDSWREFYRPFAAEVLKGAERLYESGELDGSIIKAMRAAWEKFDVIFSEEVREACLIHGDLNVGNIMVSGTRVSGFIDPLNSMYADREYDLFQFDNLTGKRFFLRETYIKKYGASRYCMQKLAFYGLWNEVYCYIKSGVLVNLIMKPLVRNMVRRLGEL